MVNHRRRTRAWLFATAVAAMLACLVCLAPAPARAAEREWHPVDTCEWSILDGELIVRPAGGAAEGVLKQPSNGMPWKDQKTKITSAKFQGTVHLEQEETINDGLFEGYNRVKSIDLSGLDTANITDMRCMFRGCSRLESIDLSVLNTGAATVMWNMFEGCSRLVSANLSGLSMSSATNLSSLFAGCARLESVNLSGVNTEHATEMVDMFRGCSSLRTLDVSDLDTQTVQYAGGMFGDCTSLVSLDLSGFDTRSVTSMSGMFIRCSALKTLDLSWFDTANVTNMGWMFSGCSSLESLDLSHFDTGSVTTMGGMFEGCAALASLNLAGFNTETVTDMDCMFSGCASLATLDLSGFDTSNVTEMGGMFSKCSSLVNLDLSGFDTRLVRSMGTMFSDCSSLESLNLSSFDTRAVKAMVEMFMGCSSLTHLDLSAFDTDSVTNMKRMFEGCRLSSLTVGPNFAFHSASGTSNEAVLDGFWKSSADGKTHPGDALPSFVAATYTKADPAPVPEVFTVTFKADGRVFDTQRVEEGKPAARPATDPVKEGHAFAAWQLDGSDYDFKTPVTADIELVARFEKIPEPAPQVDKAALQAKYDEVKDLKADGYTADSWQAFARALGEAKRVLDDDGATQPQVDEALRALTSAHAGLTEKPAPAPQVNKAALEAAVKEARALKAEDYKTMTWHPFADALDAAEIVLADDEVNQAAVDAAVKALADARKGLKPIEKVAFADVDGETPHRDDVLWLAANGISKGWPTAEGAFDFRPYAAVTRADMAAFLYRLVGEPAFDEGAVSFADVDEGTPHRRAILWLASEGISRGWTGPDGSLEFRPYAQIARCDMAAFLYRLAGEPALDAGGASFADVDASTPHRQAVLWMAASGVSAGWTEADGTKTFRPYAQIVRCDMAAFLHRMADKGLVAPR